MIPKMLARRLFLAVNNPWLCSADDDPVKMCYDMDYILQEQPLTKRLGLRTDFRVEDRYSLFPMHRLYIHLEAVGTTTAIDLGEITSVNVKDMTLILHIRSENTMIEIRLPTDCEDLNEREYALKKNDFEIRNVMTNETNYEI